MGFQGRQVSFESSIPLIFRAAPQHPDQFLPVVSAMQVLVLLRAFAVLLHNETLVLGTGPGATVYSEFNGTDFTVAVLGCLLLKTVSSPMQSWDFHHFLEMRPLFYMPVESNGVMKVEIWPSLLHVQFCFACVNYKENPFKYCKQTW